MKYFGMRAAGYILLCCLLMTTSVADSKEVLNRTVQGCGVFAPPTPQGWAVSWDGICAGSEYLALGPGTLMMRRANPLGFMIIKGWMLNGRWTGEYLKTHAGIDSPAVWAFEWNGTSYHVNNQEADSFTTGESRSAARVTRTDLRNLDVWWFNNGPGQFRAMSMEMAAISPVITDTEECSSRKKCDQLWKERTKSFFQEMETFITNATPHVEAAKEAVDLVAARAEMSRRVAAEKGRKATQTAVANASARQLDMAQATQESRPVKTPNIELLLKNALGSQ